MGAIFLSLACFLTACGGNPDPSLDAGTSSAQSSLPSALVTFTISGTGATVQTDVPLTFGEAFAPGEVPSSSGIQAMLDDGTKVPLQVDIKAKHPDGSLRHGLFSVVLPHLVPKQLVELNLVKGAVNAKPASLAMKPDTLLNSGFTAQVNAAIGDKGYSIPIESLLRSGNYTTWLSGPVVNEWIISSPLVDSDQTPHPHLSARVAIRHYAGANKARVDVTVENDWAFEPSPQNFVYNAEVLIGGQSVYRKTALTHFHHARWRKTFWWNGAPAVQVKHDVAHLLASRAIPNYDTSVAISSTAISTLDSQWRQAHTEPMGSGLVVPYMPTTGGRADIGPLPQWAAMYLLSMDSRAEAITLGIGDLAGSWPIHYRDKRTNRPVSLRDYPYMTLLGRYSNTINPATGKSEQFPACGGDCSTAPYNYMPDSSHQPSMAYLPYLLTGDHYYLEELQFWANWNMVQANPAYRDLDKGLMKWDQVRGQAWSLRTLGQAAYITPDSDSLKAYFVDRLQNNLAWYNATYATGAPNQLGVLDGTGQYAFSPLVYKTPSGTQTGIAPWQDDFFTWTVGYLADMGFADATPILKWKSKFPIDRMTAPGYCWIDGATYSLAIKASSTAPVFRTISDAYQATMRTENGGPLVNSTGAAYLDQPCGSQAQADWRTQYDRDRKNVRIPWVAGEMDGYAWSTLGYPSNMQPALAVAATSGLPNAQAAWDKFMQRTVKPKYSEAPQWAIVPRQ